MSLAERIEELSAPQAKPCKYARIIAELRETDDGTDEFDQLVMDRKISGSAASDALHKEGHFIGDTVVRKHASRSCCCFR